MSQVQDRNTYVFVKIGYGRLCRTNLVGRVGRSQTDPVLVVLGSQVGRFGGRRLYDGRKSRSGVGFHVGRRGSAKSVGIEKVGVRAGLVRDRPRRNFGSGKFMGRVARWRSHESQSA